jgi:hypothetical protein
MAASAAARTVLYPSKRENVLLEFGVHLPLWNTGSIFVTLTVSLKKDRDYDQKNE